MIDTSFNVRVLRDYLYNQIIQNCIQDNIFSVKKRIYKNIDSVYDYLYKDNLALFVFYYSMKVLSQPLVEENVKAQNTFSFIRKCRDVVTEEVKFRTRTLPEIFLVAWLSTDEFRWHNQLYLPKQLTVLKNTFEYDFNYGLVEKVYEPICFYSLIKSNLDVKSSRLTEFIKSLPPNTFKEVNDNTKEKITNHFNLDEKKLRALDKLYDKYSKNENLNLF